MELQTSRFETLGEAFFTRLHPTPLPAPYWVGRSGSLARALDLPDNWHEHPQHLEALTGNSLLPGASPLASVYSGHQFGQWAGQLGDGRAILLGERTTPGGPQEIQLKGAGLTPYSRMGDGRAVLRSSIREFLCSEAMHALGIPTTRALCVTGSNTPVRREEIETAAVVTRVAPSFIRFGHFEHFCHTGQHAALRQLADFVIDHFYPECRQADGNPYARLLEAVSARTAELLAQWQAVGFCHGVMNTDNMSILGLTIDYGPFQFMDAFDPGHICNHSDNAGRYAYARQPNIAYWNLFCLGQALLPLIEDQDVTVAALEAYRPAFSQAFRTQVCRKLGLPGAELQHEAAATATIGQLLELLAAQRVDHSIFWRRLSLSAQDGDPERTRELFLDTEAFDRWLLTYQELSAQMGQAPDANLMLNTNPAFVLRNHVGELAIRAAQQGDFSVVQSLHQVLRTPFDDHPAHRAWADFPPDWASSIAISCSS